MSFKSNLQAMRKRAGFKSAKAFAEHMGVNEHTYTKYEQGTAMMSLLQAWEFADELGCTLDELAGRRSPSKPELTNEEQNLITAYRGSNAQGKAAIDAVAMSQQGMEGKSEDTERRAI